jgi:hypothetical protein
MEKPASEKLSHLAVHYQHPSQHPGKECDDCAHYIRATPPRCEGVQSPIRPEDYCDNFKRKSRIAQAMKKE